jgi:hypothetical protein
MDPVERDDYLSLHAFNVVMRHLLIEQRFQNDGLLFVDSSLKEVGSALEFFMPATFDAKLFNDRVIMTTSDPGLTIDTLEMKRRILLKMDNQNNVFEGIFRDLFEGKEVVYFMSNKGSHPIFLNLTSPPGEFVRNARIPLEPTFNSFVATDDPRFKRYVITTAPRTFSKSSMFSDMVRVLDKLKIGFKEEKMEGFLPYIHFRQTDEHFHFHMAADEWTMQGALSVDIRVVMQNRILDREMYMYSPIYIPANLKLSSPSVYLDYQIIAMLILNYGLIPRTEGGIIERMFTRSFAITNLLNGKFDGRWKSFDYLKKDDSLWYDAFSTLKAAFVERIKVLRQDIKLGKSPTVLSDGYEFHGARGRKFLVIKPFAPLTEESVADGADSLFEGFELSTLSKLEERLMRARAIESSLLTNVSRDEFPALQKLALSDEVTNSPLVEAMRLRLSLESSDISRLNYEGAWDQFSEELVAHPTTVFMIFLKNDTFFGFKSNKLVPLSPDESIGYPEMLYTHAVQDFLDIIQASGKRMILDPTSSGKRFLLPIGTRYYESGRSLVVGFNSPSRLSIDNRRIQVPGFEPSEPPDFDDFLWLHMIFSVIATGEEFAIFRLGRDRRTADGVHFFRDGVLKFRELKFSHPPKNAPFSATTVITLGVSYFKPGFDEETETFLKSNWTKWIRIHHSLDDYVFNGITSRNYSIKEETASIRSTFLETVLSRVNPIPIATTLSGSTFKSMVEKRVHIVTRDEV